MTISGYFFARNHTTLPKQQEQLQYNIQQEAHKMTAFIEELDYNVDSSAFAKIHLKLPFQSYYFEQQSLKLWNSYQNSLSHAELQKVLETQGFQLLKTNHQWYLTYHLEKKATNNIILAQAIAIPLAYQLKANSPIPLGNNIEELSIGLEGPNFYLSKNAQILLAIAIGVLLAMFLIKINSLIIQWTRKHQVWQGAVGLLLFILLFQLLPFQSFIAYCFPSLSLFNETFQISVLGTSLGKIFLSSILLLWAMSFFHREFELQKAVQVRSFLGLVLLFFSFLTISLGFLVLTSLFQSFVLDTDIIFNFDNVFQLNIFSLLAMFSSVFLLFAFFLFSHRMMLSMVHIGLNRNQRLKALLPALLGMVPILWWSASLPILQMLLIILIYLLLLDLFIESGAPTLTWMLIWILFFAAYSAVALFKFNLDKDQNIRRSYAVALSQTEDEFAERQILQLLDADQNIHKELSNNLYLNKYYEIHPISLNAIEKELKNYSKQDQFWRANNLNNANNYILRKDSTYIGLRLKNEFTPKFFHRFLPIPAFKDLSFLEENNFLVSRNGETILNKGKLSHLKLADNTTAWKTQLSSTRSVVTYQAKDGTKVTLEKPLGGYFKPLSLFSYLFMILAILAISLLRLASWSRSLPESLNIPIIGQSSLTSKIQLAVTGLIVASFFIIGYFTVSSFQQSSRLADEDKWVKKIGAALKDLEYQLQFNNPSKDSLFYETTAQSLAKIHDTEVHFYTPNGQLMATSADYIFDLGYLQKRMSPHALDELQKGALLSVQEELILDQSLKSTYVPFQLKDQIVEAYISLPYLVQAKGMSKEVASFLSALLNVYVFLLLVAAAIAIGVANSITQPITAIGNKIKALKLGRNEAIEWHSNDEIGELVKSYNESIKKLEESTERLKKSEREGAWREMAKQVAHEIKNPLTPMKLSIQHLMRVAKAAPERVEEMLPRVSKTLVEQIEGLARIATEFSNFAKMPQAKNSHFVMNEVVQSVYHLFTEVPDEKQQIDLEMVDTPYLVFADRENLMRVINNLVKNALQSIPNDQNAHIQMRLYPRSEVMVLEVEDNGTGISDELKEKVFYPNFTTKNSGMGLGLAISKDIIDMAGGRIYFETAVGKGTTFFIELPIISSSPAEE